MTFSESNFAARLGTMGDPAEGVFDLINPRHHKLGLNRPPLQVALMTRRSRYTPDRMVQDRLVECMGIGRDATLKLKVEKALTLIEWSMVDPVDLFVYNSNKQKWWQADIWSWIYACVEHGEIHRFPDNEMLYWALKAYNFPTKAHDVPTS